MREKFKHTIHILIVVLILAFVIIELKPKLAPYFVNKSVTEFEKGNLSESLIYSNIAVQLDPLEPRVHYILGEIYASRQIYGVAIKEHKRTTELNPMFYKSHYALGQIYLKMKRYDDALMELKKVLKIAPANQQAKELIESAKYIYALELINNATDAYQKGERKDARELLQIASEMRRSHMYNLFEISNIYKKKAETDKLINSLEKILRLDPKHRLAYRLIGDIYLENEEYKKAKDSYKKFLSIEPNNASIHYNLAVVYNRLKMYDDSINEFRIALSLIPDNPNIIYGLASTYKNKEMFEEAMNLFEYLLKSGYDFPYLLLDIAEIYTETGKDQDAEAKIKEAIKLCEERLSQDSNELIYRITLDKALTQMKDYEDTKESKAKP